MCKQFTMQKEDMILQKKEKKERERERERKGKNGYLCPKWQEKSEILLLVCHTA